ncbi:hypothetical protein [Arenicella xantha]|nr:hypothetical protein [Arenicella xantha]
MKKQKSTVTRVGHFLLCALTALLIASPIQAATVYKSKEIYYPPNPNNLDYRYTDGLHKIGPRHAVFVVPTSEEGGVFGSYREEGLYVFDAVTKQASKVASLQSPGDTSIRVTRANSREVWVDVMGNLFLANSQTGSVKLINYFGVEYGGSLGPWQSCLGFGSEIFVVNNFSYISVSDYCEVQPGDSRNFIFDHSRQTLSPITYDFLPDGEEYWGRKFVFDNPLQSDKTAIGVYLTPENGDAPQVMQYWEIDPESKKTRLLKEDSMVFYYSRFSGSAKTSKGIFVCSHDNVIRIANNLSVDVMPNYPDAGCDHIKEYQDHLIWEPDTRNIFVLSDGTLRSPTYLEYNKNTYLYLGCETWGKLFYERFSGSSYSPASSINYIDERFNRVEIPLDTETGIYSCLNNKLVLTSNGGQRSIYDLLTNTNTKVFGSGYESGLTQFVELGSSLFVLKSRREESENGNVEKVDFSLHELILADLPTISPIYDLLLSD